MKKFENEYIRATESRIHNIGLHAKKLIPEDTRIIRYIGDKLTHKQADKRLDNKQTKEVYLFELDAKYTIDGDTNNNIAKYINHSCEPNCYTEIEDGEIWILASRDIKRGEELSYDYGFQRAGWDEHPCLCGSQNCFGFIVDEKHWPSIRKTKRYQKLQALR
ncbi:MAG: SET domain-containing protein-lysine N-methyltransferase [Coxiellaceae bacterium]|nr:SET domain-containing protein-lysine N-methyltransferase [Coxiellaceae bacterium]